MVSLLQPSDAHDEPEIDQQALPWPVIGFELALRMVLVKPQTDERRDR